MHVSAAWENRWKLCKLIYSAIEWTLMRAQLLFGFRKIDTTTAAQDGVKLCKQPLEHLETKLQKERAQMRLENLFQDRMTACSDVWSHIKINRGIEKELT